MQKKTKKNAHKHSLVHRYIHCCSQILDIHTVPHSHKPKIMIACRTGKKSPNQISIQHLSKNITTDCERQWSAFQNTICKNQHFPSMSDKRLIVVLRGNIFTVYICSDAYNNKYKNTSCMNNAQHHLSFWNVTKNMQQTGQI